MLPSSKFSRLALSVAGLLAVLLFAAIEGIRSPATRLLFSDLLQGTIILWAAYCSVHVARNSSGYLRQLWTLLASALFLGTAAQALETYYQSIVHAPNLTPWPSDILFSLWVLPAVMMLVSWPAEKSSGIDWLQVLDFAQIGIVALTAYLYFFYAPSRWEAEGAQMVRQIFWVQLLRDMALGAGFLFQRMTVSSRSIRAFFGWMCGFFFAAGATDLIDLVVPGSFAGRVSWTDLTWCAPYLLVAVFAATWKGGEEATVQEASSSVRGVIVSQVLPVSMPLLVLFMSRRLAIEQVTLAWVAVTCSFLVSAARLVLTNVKQRRIVDDLLQAEQALVRSEHMFSTAFRSSPDAVGISMLPEGRFLEVNDGFVRLTGYTREEAVGKTPVELDLWVDPAHRAKVLARLREHGEVLEEEFQTRTKRGEIRIGEYSASVIELDGQPCVLSIVRDLTERKEAEAALLRSEHMFSTAFRSSPDAVVITTLPDGHILEVNDGFTRMTGYTHEETVGKTSVELDLWVDPVHRGKVLAKLREEGELLGQEFQFRTKGGEVRIGEFSGSAIELDGRPCALSIIRDLTARKAAEAALRVSEERFRTLVENLQVGVVLCGPSGEVRFANAAAEKIFGISTEEARGKNSAELGIIQVDKDGTEIPFPMRPVPRAIATGQPIQSEVYGWYREGSSELHWVLGTALPQFARDGAVASVIASFTDITEQRRAEEALRQLSNRLLQLQDEERRRLGRELHDSLAQSVLAVNLYMAQATGSSTPLDEPTRRALSEARRVLQEMSREIRTLSYLLHPPVLDELGLASAIKEYSEGFGERSGIAVELELQAGFERLPQESETALFRIVQESLANIQRHSGSEWAKIRLRGDSTRVDLEISDRGQGMDKTKIKHGDGARVRFGVGILGMRERMAQLGGKLEIESSPTGTTVRAFIPLTAEVPDAAAHPHR